MRFNSATLFGSSLIISQALCNLIGPTFPAPRDISSDASLVATGWRNVTATLENYLNNETSRNVGASASLSSTTFSVGLFSLHDLNAQSMQFHFSGPETRNASTGTNIVDGDSIYRVASISKLVTVLGGLLDLEEEDWDRSLADIFPAFAAAVEEYSEDPDSVYNVRWDQVTLRALSAHLAGVQSGLAGLANGVPGLIDSPQYGLPYLDDTIPPPPCFSVEDPLSCPHNLVAEGAASQSPAFPPWSGPAYTNQGYILLGIAMANLTGRPVRETVQDLIFGPLNMNSSTYRPQNGSELSRSVIIGDPVTTLLDPDLTLPSGGMWSTTNDLAKLGMGILNSTLLSPDQTRKWMKPLTHTSHLQYAVGRPWEIYRYLHSDSGIVTDMYTKGGDSGFYSSVLVLLPDFDAGFSILSAATDGQSRFEAFTLIADLVTEAILPALMNQAGSEAESRFAGTYVSSVDGLNSSITLSIRQASEPGPGLEVTSWVSNGTDLTPSIPEILGLPAYLGGNDTRLVPTIPSPRNNGQLPFRVYTVGRESEYLRFGSPLNLVQSYYDNDWVISNLPGNTYRGRDFAYFVFDVDMCTGSVEAVTPAAWRVRLDRTD